MKKIFLLLSVLVLPLTLALPAYANCSGDHCPMKKGGHGHGGEKYECPIVAKFMKKAHFFLEHQQELGLKDEQVKAIKDLKTEVEKNYIRQSAEMKIFQLDMEAKMSEPKVDVEGINGMIDKGMASMAESAKASVASYAKLKGVLSDEQMSKAKELWHSKKS